MSWVGFLKKQTVRQGPACKWFIGGWTQETLWEKGKQDTKREKIQGVLLNKLPQRITRAQSHGETPGDSVDLAWDIPAKGQGSLFSQPQPCRSEVAGTLALLAPQTCPTFASQEKAHGLQATRPCELWCYGWDICHVCYRVGMEDSLSTLSFIVFLCINDILKSEKKKTGKKNTKILGFLEKRRTGLQLSQITCREARDLPSKRAFHLETSVPEATSPGDVVAWHAGWQRYEERDSWDKASSDILFTNYKYSPMSIKVNNVLLAPGTWPYRALIVSASLARELTVALGASPLMSVQLRGDPASGAAILFLAHSQQFKKKS